MAERKTPEAEGQATKASEIAPSLPSLTALQFLVLDLLSSNATAVSAHELKRGVATLAQDYDGPKFYQLMGRLIRDQLVTGQQRQINTEGGTVERTFYTPTESGRNSLVRTRVFYDTRHKLSTALTGE